MTSTVAEPLEVLLDDPLQYKTLLESLQDGVYFVDRSRRILYWNRGAERISGFSRTDVVGRCCWENLLSHMDSFGTRLCHEGCPLAATLEDGQFRNAEIYLKHREGHRVPVLVRIAPIRNGDGEIIGAVETFSDNTSKLAALELARRLETLAYVDALTQAGNRRYTEMRLEESWKQWQYSGIGMGVLFIDIDDFKLFNDRYGHAAGDRVLRMTADTLRNGLRSFDYLGRMGGEEFLIILSAVGLYEAAVVAERCRTLVAQSSLSENEELRVTISIGATVGRSNEGLPDLLQRADRLLYDSKNQGRNRVTCQ